MSLDRKHSVLRPHDMLSLDLELVHLRVTDDGTALVPEDADAFVVVTFPPQAVAEAVNQMFTMPVRTALAGPTRLVFRIPAGTVVPLTTEGLLDWTAWTPVVAPTALPRGTSPGETVPEAAPPTDRETAIEFPWRLVVSPDRGGRWNTDNDAARSNHHQLWSAVLGSDGRRGGDVRALAALPEAGPAAFTGSLSTGNREQIAKLSSDFRLPVSSGTYFTPEPLAARRLELTSLGANAELEAAWDYPEFPPDATAPAGYEFLDLRQYTHTAALGRDHLVRSVTVGYLCPLGHRAVVLDTVERVPKPLLAGGAAGVLIRTAELIVQQPEVDYRPLVGAFARGGREWPFCTVRITTTSAKIAPRSVDSGPFWLHDPEERWLMLRAVGSDITGSNTVDFSLPQLFVPFQHIGCHRLIHFAFDDGDHDAARTVQLAGQSMAFAAEGDQAGSTTLPTSSFRYDLELPPGAFNPDPDFAVQSSAAPPCYVPRFLPRIVGITATVPAVDELLGTSGQRKLILDATYLKNGFNGANRAQTFVGFETELPLELSPQRGGGLASPALGAQALSRTLGPVPAPEKLQQGTVDLSAFGRMKLLGTIALKDLLDGSRMGFTGGDTAGSPVDQTQLDRPDFLINPPRLTTRRLESPDVGTVQTRFLWKPPLIKRKVGFLNLTDADLLLDATTTRVRGGEAVTVVTGRLRKVELAFAQALTARIGTLRFHSESGRKVDVEAKDVRITFEGPLAFVNALQSVLPADGFDDPPFLTVDSQGVVSGYTLGVPSVGVGVFSVQNIAVTAALSIPFTDRPAGMRFAISERHKPFLVTVSLFGGGGFLALAAGARGLEQVEASIEFGGSVSLNLGVASGGVSVMAGVYFGIKGSSVELTGFLRCGGHLDVLGLISISLEFYLAFTYRKKAGGGSEIWGQATLTVSVKIAFISKSVTLSVERRFAGSDGDPTFEESFSPSQWTGYLQAFA